MLDKNIQKIASINQYLINHKDEFNKEVGGIIKKNRISKQISIERFADMILTSNSYVSQIEQGSNGLSLVKFVLICNALKIKPLQIIENYVFYEDDNEDILYKELQSNKNLSKNLINYMKDKY